MRTTITLDDDLIESAARYTGIKERATIVRLALQQFVAIQAEKRLADLQGSLPDLVAPPRRRPPTFVNP